MKEVRCTGFVRRSHVRGRWHGRSRDWQGSGGYDAPPATSPRPPATAPPTPSNRRPEGRRDPSTAAGENSLGRSPSLRAAARRRWSFCGGCAAGHAVPEALRRGRRAQIAPERPEARRSARPDVRRFSSSGSAVDRALTLRHGPRGARNCRRSPVRSVATGAASTRTSTPDAVDAAVVDDGGVGDRAHRASRPHATASPATSSSSAGALQFAAPVPVSIEDSTPVLACYTDDYADKLRLAPACGSTCATDRPDVLVWVAMQHFHPGADRLLLTDRNVIARRRSRRSSRSRSPKVADTHSAEDLRDLDDEVVDVGDR